MMARQDDPEGMRRRVESQGEGDLDRASIADLLAELAQVEDAIRSAAEAGYPLTAGLARRENALVEALRRRGGPAS